MRIDDSHLTQRTFVIATITSSICFIMASLWGWWAFRLTRGLEKLAELPGADEVAARKVGALGALLALELPIAATAVVIAAVACVPRYKRQWAFLALGLSIANVVLRFSLM